MYFIYEKFKETGSVFCLTMSGSHSLDQWFLDQRMSWLYERGAVSSPNFTSEKFHLNLTVFKILTFPIKISNSANYFAMLKNNVLHQLSLARKPKAIFK